MKKPKCSVCPDDIKSIPKNLKKYQVGTRTYSDPREYEIAARKYKDSLDLYTYNNNRLQNLLKLNKQAGATNKLERSQPIPKSVYESASTISIDGKYKKQGEDFESLEQHDIDPIDSWKLTELYDKYNAPSFIKKMGLFDSKEEGFVDYGLVYKKPVQLPIFKKAEEKKQQPAVKPTPPAAQEKKVEVVNPLVVVKKFDTKGNLVEQDTVSPTSVNKRFDSATKTWKQKLQLGGDLEKYQVGTPTRKKVAELKTAKGETPDLNPLHWKRNISKMSTDAGYETSLKDFAKAAIFKGEGGQGHPETNAFAKYLGEKQVGSRRFEKSPYKENTFQLHNYEKEFPDDLSKLSEEDFKAMGHYSNTHNNVLKPFSDYVFGRHTVNKVPVENGGFYLEYNDRWDLNPERFVKQALGIDKPFNTSSGRSNVRNPEVESPGVISKALDFLGDKVERALFNPFDIYGRIYYDSQGKKLTGPQKSLYQGNNNSSPVTSFKYGGEALPKDLKKYQVGTPTYSGGMLPMATVSSPMSESPIARNLRVKKALQEGRDVNTAKTANERGFENTVKELSGAGSVERIYNNPKKTAVGTAKALANIAALPVGVGQGLSEVVRGKEFNMGNNPLTGGKYSEGFDEALDVATVLPAMGLVGKGLGASKKLNATRGLTSKNHNLRLWDIFNKKKPEPFLPPSLNAEAELARANADALAFSQSPYNRIKLQEFRPGQDFNVTNTEALFHNDPVARERFTKLMKDESDFLNYGNTENWQGTAEGNYGARDFGDMGDLAIVNKNKPQSKIYPAAIHETGHSRSVRLPATKEERAILDDAWKGLKEANGSSLSVLEGEAVQGELRMLLKDKLGKRVYTQKNAGEIETALEKMIAANHPYMQNINDFDISKIIKSLNKIGLAGVVPTAIGVETLRQSKEDGKVNLPKYQVGTVFVNSAQDPRNLAFIDSTRAGQQSLAGLMNDIRVGDIPATMTNGQPIRRVEDLARANPNLMRIGAGRASGVNMRVNLNNGDPNGLDANMPLSGAGNKPVVTLDGPAFMSNDYYRMPRQQVVVGEDPALKLDKKNYLSIPVRSPNAATLKELDEPLKIREIPREKPAMVDQNFSSAKLLRILKKPSGYINKGDGKGNLPKFELGGAPPEKKPRVITNLKDFKVAEKAYNDSLTLHNYGENTIKFIKAATKYIPERAPGFEVAQKAFKSLEDLNGVAPSSFDPYWKRWKYSDGHSESMSAGHFTKPVQPVIYKPIVDTPPKPPKPPTKESAVVQKKVEQAPVTVPSSIAAPTPIVKEDIKGLWMPSGKFMLKKDFIDEFTEDAWKKASGQNQLPKRQLGGELPKFQLAGPMPTKQQYQDSIQTNYQPYLEKTKGASPLHPRVENGYNCINGVCNFIKGTNAHKFEGKAYSGNATFNNDREKNGYYEADWKTSGFEVGDVVQYSRFKENALRIDGMKITPKNAKELYPQHAEVILKTRVDDEGKKWHTIGHNEGKTTFKVSEISEEDLMKHGVEGYKTFDGLIVNRYDPEKVKENKAALLARQAVFQGNNEHASKYNTPPNFIYKGAKGAKSEQNMVDYFKKNYQVLGRQSNMSPETLHKAFTNIVGIGHQESDLGGNMEVKMPQFLMDESRKVRDALPFQKEDDWKKDYWKSNADGVQSKYKSETEFKKALASRSSISPEVSEYLYLNSPRSKGIFKQKELSERGRFFDSNLDSEEKQFVSAMQLYMDNYDVVKKKYPGKTDDEYLDLATLMHNAPSKVLTPEYVEYYQKNNKMDYVNKVKAQRGELVIGETFKPSGTNLIGAKDSTLANATPAPRIATPTKLSPKEVETLKAFMNKK